MTFHDLPIWTDRIQSTFAFSLTFSPVCYVDLQQIVFLLQHIVARRALHTEEGSAFSFSFSSGCSPCLFSSVSGGSAHQLPPPSFDDHVDVVHLLSGVVPAFWSISFQAAINNPVQCGILKAIVIGLGVCVEISIISM